ncbi:MAG: hypothetical protein ACUZ8E_04370 [Candidatus Anammoxibacter sp.]
MSDQPEIVEADEPTMFDKIRWMKNDVIHFLKINIQHKTIRLIGGVPADFNCNSVQKAKTEMDYVWASGDEMQEAIKSCILDILAVFANEGHSGSSAGYTIPYITTLLKQEPISPLTGEDWEWHDISEHCGEVTYQNNRMSHVFKNNNGAYDINGKVFGDKMEDGEYCFYTNRESRVPVEFPYTAKTIYVDAATGEEIKQH